MKKILLSLGTIYDRPYRFFNRRFWGEKLAHFRDSRPVENKKSVVMEKSKVATSLLFVEGEPAVISFEKFFVNSEAVVFLDSPKHSSNISAVFYAEHIGKFFVLDLEGRLVKEADFSYKDFGVANLKALSNGSYLVQTKKPCITILLNCSFIVKKEVKEIMRPWHGSSSIDEDSEGNVIFSEYIVTKDAKPKELNVWKSADGGFTWRKVFVLESSPEYGGADIRHFHTCFFHFGLGIWYISTGDKGIQNRIYFSNDNGETWARVEPEYEIPSRLIDASQYRRALRFTSVITTEEGVLWASDDDLSINKSGVFKFDGFGRLRIVGLLGKNLVRSAIKLPNIDGGLSKDVLFLTECKSDKSGADAWVYSDEREVARHLTKITSDLGPGNYPFTRSKASHRFFNNTAYTFLDGFFDKGVDDARALKIRIDFIKDQDVDDLAQQKLSRLRSIEDRVMVFFHAQRTAGTTVKKYFSDLFGAENCLYQKSSPDFCKWSDISPDVLRKYSIYAGHNNFSTSVEVHDLSWYFSVVRDPVDRIISLYYYLKGRPEHKLHKYAVEFDIEDFFEYSLTFDKPYVSNTQCRRISGFPDYEKAVRVFEEYYGLLIPFENLSEGVGIIGDFLRSNYPKNEVALSSGRTSGGDRSVVSDNLRSRILEENLQDYALWIYVRSFYSKFVFLIHESMDMHSLKK
ncbi:sulfotransferase family 2 domain-containing protein [Marinobacter lacisalsi]|uniref:Sulfotransferase family 2 domain-containing protein n=1 Tax=Marinobacter lacisalsi TaxID=475979 RepID=A0ABV8QKE8_9GAMM